MMEMWQNSQYFKPMEVKNSFTMSPILLAKLNNLRRRYGAPIVISGSWRPVNGELRDSAHQVNLAGVWEGVDLACSSSRERYKLLGAIYSVGFSRIGVYDQHIHVDVATEAIFAPDVCWWGVSK